jgi:hypothetical protein
MYVSAMSTDVRPPELERRILPQPLVTYERNPFENDFGEWHKSGVPLILMASSRSVPSTGGGMKRKNNRAVTTRSSMHSSIQWKVLLLFTNKLIA